MPCTLLYLVVLIYLYVGCMCKCITLQDYFNFGNLICEYLDRSIAKMTFLCGLAFAVKAN